MAMHDTPILCRDFHFHPLLKVPVCQGCYTAYHTDEFTVGELVQGKALDSTYRT
jgi:hypothetical protein